MGPRKIQKTLTIYFFILFVFCPYLSNYCIFYRQSNLVKLEYQVATSFFHWFWKPFQDCCPFLFVFYVTCPFMAWAIKSLPESLFIVAVMVIMDNILIYNLIIFMNLILWKIYDNYIAFNFSVLSAGRKIAIINNTSCCLRLRKLSLVTRAAWNNHFKIWKSFLGVGAHSLASSPHHLHNSQWYTIPTQSCLFLMN